MPYLAVMKNP